MYYLGGMTITDCGWVNPQTVFVEFVSQYTSGWLWQLYWNRTLVGCTSVPGERRVVGQIVASDLPAPLTLVRVDVASSRIDYGDRLPASPWNRYRLDWTAADMPADTDHFDVVRGSAVGEPVDLANVVAQELFVGDGEYSFELPPFSESGAWDVGIVPRDNALPLGNAGATVSGTVTIQTPPPDVIFDANGKRFDVSIEAGVLTASFLWESE